MKIPGVWVTIGKQGFSKDTMSELISHNIDGIRINTGRSTYDWIEEIIEKLYSIGYPLDKIYLDVANTKPRLSISGLGEVKLGENSSFVISKYPSALNPVILQNDSFFDTVSKNDIVYFGDGEIECIVTEVINEKVYLISKNQGLITNGVSVGIKGKDFFHFFIESEEVERINSLLEIYPIGMILSFVETKENIEWAFKTFKNAKSIIPKIEIRQAVENIDGILDISDCIFIGRGDLALSLGIEKLGIVQKQLIRKAREANVKISIGTGTLDSLKWSDIPLRAEVIDITNSCYEEVDYIALTSETGGSKEPYKAILYLERILEYIKSV